MQGSLRQIGAKCRSKVLQNAPWEHSAILLTCNIWCLFLSGLLRQVLLYTIKFNGYPIWDFLLKNKFPSNRPILVKQGRLRGNKNIFKVGLSRYYLNIGKKQFLNSVNFQKIWYDYWFRLLISQIDTYSRGVEIIKFSTCPRTSK